MQYSFNSKLVRLKGTGNAGRRPIRVFRFNSKLVRLKGNYPIASHNGKPMFQFQTGAIKSYSVCQRGSGGISKFQFQTGAIKSYQTDLVLVSIPKFQFQTGAIKRNVGVIGLWSASRFQFQTGAIKSQGLTPVTLANRV